jgi:hypothetical protein
MWRQWPAPCLNKDRQQFKFTQKKHARAHSHATQAIQPLWEKCQLGNFSKIFANYENHGKKKLLK